MEEDGGVKAATVTRLRRRLSVEQSEDGNSSPAPSTPTKKRGGRLAAKPQLELINENTPVSSPRKTRRKSIATEAEEKPITPSRRSARIKSNSSIVSETQLVQATDSPRAKRAARRNSQAGSDNEGPATPARQTRQTRKDSASSVENQDTGALNKPLPVVEMVIEEEPENEVQKTADKSESSPAPASEELSPNSARKSRRLLEKRNQRSGSHKTDQDTSNNSLNISITVERVASETESVPHSPLNKSVKSKNPEDDLSESNISLLTKLDTEAKLNKSDHNRSASALDNEQNDKSKRNLTEPWPTVRASQGNESINLSDSELSMKKKNKSNKSSSDSDSPKIIKTDTFIEEENASQSFLDTSSKRKKRQSDSSFTKETEKSKDDNHQTTEALAPKESNIKKDISSVQSDNPNITSDVAVLFDTAPENVQATVSFEDSNSVSAVAADKHLDSEDQCVPVVKHDFKESLSPQNRTIVSNAEHVFSNEISKDNASLNIPRDDKDDVDNSCEPMEIDETIHEEIFQKSLDILSHSKSELKSLSTTQEANESKRTSSIFSAAANTSALSKTTEEEANKSKRNTSISNSITDTSDRSAATEDENNKSKRKSSISNAATDNSALSRTTEEQNKSKRKSSVSNGVADTSGLSKTTGEETNKSKRKSSISNAGDTLDRSKDDNKSTLILSKIKDVSSTSENPNSPKPTQINEVLSKSEVNVNSIVNKKVSKGNLSLNDIKGTPKPKNIQKLTMQTSTPIITQEPDVKTKRSKPNDSTAKNTANFSKSVNDSDSSEEESDDDESSLEKSKLLDDEAEEASDDYESGDSQDEEERRYEAENEIVERGETLTSDDDVSNDTDYEKDSFIVSSDPEDNELLSGSGDDLDMSDNELTMSKKSKNKFNERKLKEQKNASREMFESRHKLNTSDQNSPTPKLKKNRMRLDSSLLASDEEKVIIPKKNKRMRLDSTLETSVKHDDTNSSLNKSKNKDKTLQDDFLNTIDKHDVTIVSLQKSKKNKSMQDSICNKSAIDEEEITILKESTTENSDPLQVHLKQEPKTPQKDLNISVVQFTDRQEIENVQIRESNSVLNQTGTDPLQATIACQDSDSSESEEIMQNYDSVLNDLNKKKKTKLNNNNISLIMDNKSKKTRVEPIIDQLNLTHTKSKKNKNHSEDVVDSKSIKIPAESLESDNESSNSIDLQLLFSEDNGSDDESEQNKDDDDCIPLKKTPGKTNIRESIGMNTSQKDSTLNESSKKKKKRKSSIATAVSNEEQDSSGKTSLNTSTAQKNKDRTSLSLESPEEPEGQLGNESILNKSSSKKNKQRISLTAAESDEVQESMQADELNKSKSKKKKQRTSSVAETAAKTLDILSGSLNESGIKKKKKHSISAPAVEGSQDMLTVNVSLNESAKKKKKKHSISEPAVEETRESIYASDTNELNERKSTKKKQRKSSVGAAAVETLDILSSSLNESGKKKKKHSISEPAAEELQDMLNKSKNGNVSLNESGLKKKKKHSISEPAAVESTQGDLFFIDTKGTLENDEETEESTTARTPKSEKKKEKKIPQKAEPLVDEDSDGAPDEAPYLSVKATEADLLNTETVTESAETGSGKKKKKKKKKSSAAANQSVDEDSDGAPDEAPYLSVKATEADLLNTETVTESAETGSGKKKKKKKKKSSAAANPSGQSIDTGVDIASNSKKRKRKSSNAESSQGDLQESVETATINEVAGSQKKKRKISHNEDKNSSGTSESTHAKKKNKKNLIFQETAFELETVEAHVKKNKKRKNRDEDGDNKQAKVSKDSSFQEVHVPRLPDNILSQLADKPRKRDTTGTGSRDRVISTSNFIVETARQKRIKPSNYLEESIYLDADSPIAKKEKPRNKQPKVLPFIPTASISDSGFTTNFKINKLSQTTTKFEAEPFGFSKESYLQKKSIKRLGTYDQYKKQIRHKLSKF